MSKVLFPAWPIVRGGMMQQVDIAGKVVWEYINPYFFPNHRGVEMNEVFCALHYTKDELPFL